MTARQDSSPSADADASRAERLRAGDLDELVQVGISLLTERNYAAVQQRILTHARKITDSDAASLYLVEPDGESGRRLRFALTQCELRPDLPFHTFTLPLDRASIAGYAALSGEPVVLTDAYRLPPGVPYAFNRSFDEQFGYRTKANLVVPMPNHLGEVIGVLQLLNPREPGSPPFRDADDIERRSRSYEPHDVQMARALAGQAAVSIENSQLYEAIERLFEGFVKAAVKAIEQRDPTTFGHSERVAALTVALAEAANRAVEGPYAALRFSEEELRELRYAALLHDFGKVGVREHVLVKGSRLYEEDLTLIHERCALLLRTASWRHERARADHLLEHAGGDPAVLAALAAAHRAELEALDGFRTLVERCNDPGVGVAPGSEPHRLLCEFADRFYEAPDGSLHPWLTQRELSLLSIPRGTLDRGERREVESHVEHTYSFLQRIPWTPELGQVPEIARLHHEKLDGSGYPLGARAAEIPVQTRMMTIADVFDALTSTDRPYMKAISSDAALEVLRHEAERGALDPELVQLFVRENVYLATAR